MNNEQEILSQDEQQEQLEEEFTLERILNLAFNIDCTDQMIDGAKKLAEFVDIVEQRLGLLNLNLNVSINPFEVKDKEGNKIVYQTNAYGENVEEVEELNFEDDEIEEDE